MKRFARLFELEGIGQMLFTCLPDDEGGCSFQATFNREDGPVTCHLSADESGKPFTYEQGTQQLEKLNPEIAGEIYKGLQEVITALEAGEVPEGIEVKP